jgi:hypothetical protein
MIRYQSCMPLGHNSACFQQSPHCHLVVVLGPDSRSRNTKRKNVTTVNTLSMEPRRDTLSTYDLYYPFQNTKPKQPKLPPKGPHRSCEKKLLIFDINGVLADVTLDVHKTLKAPKYIEKKAVFKRPFCDDFLKFCFENFHIGVWSSRHRNNLDPLVKYLMGDMRHNLLFCWDSSKCTNTGFTTIGNFKKPLMLKQIKKLWTKEQSDLPWAKGEFSPCNTLLIDDSPYKALCNPPHTAIFPYSYDFRDEGDKALENGGYFREYLEELALTKDVQNFVEKHPFGQSPISNLTPSWKFYEQVIKRINNSSFHYQQQKDIGKDKFIWL